MTALIMKKAIPMNKEQQDTILAALKDNDKGLTIYQIMTALRISAYDEAYNLIEAMLANGEILSHHVDIDELVYLDPEIVSAVHATEHSAGADVFALEDVTIEPGGTTLVKSSFKIPGYLRNKSILFLALARSSFWSKYRLFLTNGVGLIDSDYPDHVMFSYCNMSDDAVSIAAGEKIGQLVRVDCKQFAPVSSKTRVSGFGSTDDTEETLDLTDKPMVEIKIEKPVIPPTPPAIPKKKS